jgi:hypothetical protein
MQQTVIGGVAVGLVITHRQQSAGLVHHKDIMILVQHRGAAGLMFFWRGFERFGG